jgi:hypothetical protein
MTRKSGNRFSEKIAQIKKTNKKAPALAGASRFETLLA